MTEHDLESVYMLAGKKAHRTASWAIFNIFDSLVDKPDDVEEFLNSIDITRLTSFEIKTLVVASRPIASKTQAYSDLVTKCRQQLKKEIGARATKKLLQGF